MSKLSGTCLCGAVSYEVEDDFRALNFCHCKQCQQSTGSAHASNLFTDVDKFTWTKGEEFAKRYDVPGRSISNTFCTECGSGLPYQSKSSGSMIVPAGTLDGPVESSPKKRNIFWVERANWYEDSVASERFDGFPE